jgi:hypothetical protein
VFDVDGGNETRVVFSCGGGDDDDDDEPMEA